MRQFPGVNIQAANNSDLIIIGDNWKDLKKKNAKLERSLPSVEKLEILSAAVCVMYTLPEIWQPESRTLHLALFSIDTANCRG